MNHGNRKGYALGENSRTGSALCPHAPYPHQQDVQYDVHHRCHQDKIQGASGIPHAPHDGAYSIVAKDADSPAADDKHIVTRILHGGLRHAQESEYSGVAGQSCQ